MKPAELLDKAQTGDVLLFRGAGFSSTAIRVLTGESFGHVALLVNVAGQLLLAEFTGEGYSLAPVLELLKKHEGARVYLGIAPDMIHAKRYEVESVALEIMKHPERQHYGFLNLPRVWLDQLTGSDDGEEKGDLVCSTFVELAWRAAGFHFPNTPDPGDYLDYCRSLYPLELT